ncbi:MAG: EAL domain-containing protein [Pseudomonadota bacterium]
MDATSGILQDALFFLGSRLRGRELVDAALAAVRTHLGMPFAYLARVDGEQATLRNVAGDGPVTAGLRLSVRAVCGVTVCRTLQADFSGKAPNGVTLPGSTQPVVSYIVLPVLLDDGTLYGLFGCLSDAATPALNARDLDVLSAFAAVIAREVRREKRPGTANGWDRNMLSGSDHRAVFQPIVQLSDGRTVGVEALSRFNFDGPLQTEDVFREAEAGGLGLELELQTLGAALGELPNLAPALYMAVNASPDVICDPRFAALLPVGGLGRLVVEVTEHSEAEDADLLQSSLAGLRGRGARIAIDDVGTGYSGLLRIARLTPDLLKIDRSLVHGIDRSTAQSAIVSALAHFAARTGCKLLGEGVESAAEAATLAELGVHLAQGFHFARPGPLSELKQSTL